MSEGNETLALALTLVKGARSLLDNPRNWTKHALARTASDTPVDSANPEAVCWCLVGALSKTRMKQGVKDENAIAIVTAITDRAVYDRTPDLNRVEFNDHLHTTHRDVLDVLDAAITLLS